MQVYFLALNGWCGSIGIVEGEGGKGGGRVRVSQNKSGFVPPLAQGVPC